MVGDGMSVVGRQQAEAEKETGRVEAFSDGVFAIAITLLVLNLKVPSAGDLPAGTGLLTVLLDQWPSYVAYVVSFLTILIMWINHHTLFKLITRTDHIFLMLNGLLLLTISVVPFPTALVAEYVERSDQVVASEIYCGLFVLIAVTFNLLWFYAARHHRLLGRHVDPRAVQDITRAYRFGPLLYLIAFALSYVNAVVSLLICGLLAVYFALPRGMVRGDRAAGTR